MIYFDNAATSYPKPGDVMGETVKLLSSPLGNPGRSGHEAAVWSGRLVYEARENLAALLDLPSPERIVFTSGATAALNMAIFGVCQALEKTGVRPHVVTSVFEHNSVLRPLFHLEETGRCHLTILSPERDGNLSARHLLRLSPDLIVLTCRSNVNGHAFFLKNAIRQLKKAGTIVIMDASQALGSETVTFSSCEADILCGPGHKGLFGLMGAGFLAVREGFETLPEAIFSGGSGNETFRRTMPDPLPERLEAGTLPVPAILSMGLGARFLMQHGVEEMGYHKRQLKRRLTEGLFALPGFRVYEPEYADGPLLFNKEGVAPEEVASHLSREGIMVRAGFHCAPLAHRYLGTERLGAVRISPGPFNTKDQVDKTLRVLSKI